jgi:hypothetical protein
VVRDLLNELVEAVGLPGPIEGLLETVVGEGKPLDDALMGGLKRVIGTKVEMQAGIAGCRHLARATTKQIDAVAEAKVRGVDAAKRGEIAQSLAEVAALHFAKAAQALTNYAPLAARVVALKEAADAIEDQGDPERLKLAALLREARQVREKKREEVRLALEAAFLATMGRWAS